jgi:hypothetical protein
VSLAIPIKATWHGQREGSSAVKCLKTRRYRAFKGDGKFQFAGHSLATENRPFSPFKGSRE